MAGKILWAYPCDESEGFLSVVSEDHSVMLRKEDTLLDHACEFEELKRFWLQQSVYKVKGVPHSSFRVEESLRDQVVERVRVLKEREDLH